MIDLQGDWFCFCIIINENYSLHDIKCLQKNYLPQKSHANMKINRKVIIFFLKNISI